MLNEPKFNPVECVRKYFFADISLHPDELIPVEPVMPYSMADPRIVDPVDVISDIDKRPNLLDYSPKEFENFIQNLFAKMGFDTKLYQASGDGGIDCVAYDPHPITGGKFIVQAKLYNRTVQPTHVRDLWGTVQHEGATKGHHDHHLRIRPRQLQVRRREAAEPHRRQWSARPMPAIRDSGPHPGSWQAEKAALTRSSGGARLLVVLCAHDWWTPWASRHGSQIDAASKATWSHGQYELHTECVVKVAASYDVKKLDLSRSLSSVDMYGYLHRGNVRLHLVVVTVR